MALQDTSEEICETDVERRTAAHRSRTDRFGPPNCAQFSKITKNVPPNSVHQVKTPYIKSIYTVKLFHCSIMDGMGEDHEQQHGPFPPTAPPHSPESPDEEAVFSGDLSEPESEESDVRAAEGDAPELPEADGPELLEGVGHRDRLLDSFLQRVDGEHVTFTAWTALAERQVGSIGSAAPSAASGAASSSRAPPGPAHLGPAGLAPPAHLGGAASSSRAGPVHSPPREEEPPQEEHSPPREEEPPPREEEPPPREGEPFASLRVAEGAEVGGLWSDDEDDVVVRAGVLGRATDVGVLGRAAGTGGEAGRCAGASALGGRAAVPPLATSSGAGSSALFGDDVARPPTDAPNNESGTHPPPVPSLSGDNDPPSTPRRTIHHHSSQLTKSERAKRRADEEARRAEEWRRSFVRLKQQAEVRLQKSFLQQFEAIDRELRMKKEVATA